MTTKTLRKRMDEHLYQTCEEMGYPLNGSEPVGVPYGLADAEEGSESWAYWQHLSLRNHTPLRPQSDNFELRQVAGKYANQFHNALDTGFWKLTKAPNGESWKCFEDYLKCPSPWGIGLGEKWEKVLKPLLEITDPTTRRYEDGPPEHVGIVQRVTEDRLADGRSSNGGDRKSKDFQNQNPPVPVEIDRDVRTQRKEEKERALNRAPAVIRQQYVDGHISLELAGRFGPYVPAKPSEAQRQRADAVAAAAADVERWIKETGLPTDTKAVTNYRKELKAVAEQALGRTNQGFKIYSHDPGRIADQLMKHLPRNAQIELVNILVKRLQAGGAK